MTPIGGLVFGTPVALPKKRCLQSRYFAQRQTAKPLNNAKTNTRPNL
jgi:hypothetical protein